MKSSALGIGAIALIADMTNETGAEGEWRRGGGGGEGWTAAHESKSKTSGKARVHN